MFNDFAHMTVCNCQSPRRPTKLMHLNNISVRNSGCVVYIHTLNNAGLFQPKFGSNMDKPKCWVKNVIKKITVETSES